MEKIIFERDNPESEEIQEKKEYIGSMIQYAKCLFQPYRNIHVFSGIDDIDVEHMMQGQNISEDPAYIKDKKAAKSLASLLDIDETLINISQLDL